MEAKYYTVQKIQAGLSLLGYDVGKIDGSAGDDFTNPQIRKFLKDNKITDVDPSDLRAVEKKVREKFLSDPKAQERLIAMSKNPGELSTEGVKALKGAMALKDIRTGEGRDRIVINGTVDQQTKEAVGKLWKENSRDIAQHAAAATPAVVKTAVMTGDNRSVAERRADDYLDDKLPRYAALKHGAKAPFPAGEKDPFILARKKEIRDEIIKYESLEIKESDVQRAFGYKTENLDLKNRIGEARKSRFLNEEQALIKGAEDHDWALSGYPERLSMDDRVEQSIRNFKFREVYGRPDKISELTNKPEWTHKPEYDDNKRWIQDYRFSRYSVVRDVRNEKGPSILDRVRGLLPISTDAPDIRTGGVRQPIAYSTMFLGAEWSQSSTDQPKQSSKPAFVATAAPVATGSARAGLIDERTMGLEARRDLISSTLQSTDLKNGIPARLMGAIWCIESRCSQGRFDKATGEYTLSSGSGSEGSWQFTKSTFAAVIQEYGKDIARDLRGIGHENEAALIEKFQNGLKNKTITKDNEELQNLRFNPYVNTVVGSHTVKEKAAAVHADPAKKGDWGKIYAAYNIGQISAENLAEKFSNIRIFPTAEVLKDLMEKKNLQAEDIVRIKNSLGGGPDWEKDWKDFKTLYRAAKPVSETNRGNSVFFENGRTGAEVLQNYQENILRFSKEFDRTFPDQTEFRASAREVTERRSAAFTPPALAQAYSGPAPG